MIWRKNGKVLINSSGLVVDSEECCCGAVPCTCPEDAPSSVTLSAPAAFVDGVDCDGEPSETPILSKLPEDCQWTWEGPACWNGKRVELASLLLVDPGGDEPCYWELTIQLKNEFGEPIYWVGRKTTGASPYDVYTFDGTTSTTTGTPATITVE